MEFSKIRYEMIGAVARITLADPGTLNAATPDMAEELMHAFARAESEARALLLTGEGRGFCSGANLSGKSVTPDTAAALDLGAGLESHYNPLVSRMRDLAIPIVTGVNGAAAGIGCSFALMGDLIVAAESAYFLQAFRRIALVPDGGATYLLTRAIGRARAMEMMLLGEKLPAAKALEWGLINRLVADEALAGEALALAENLSQGPTRTLALMRRAAWAGLDADWAEQLHCERTLQREAGASEDFSEGLSAFFGKRPPQFAGR